MANRRVGGIISFRIGGEVFNAKGNFTYNLGISKKTAVVGSDGVHGFTEQPQVAYIEGTLTDTDELDLQALRETRDSTCTLALANGKVIVIEEAFEASDGEGSSEEGELQIRMEGVRGREVSA